MRYTYRCAEAGCSYEYASDDLAYVRREGRGHQLHAHGEDPPDPLVVDERITRAE